MKNKNITNTSATGCLATILLAIIIVIVVIAIGHWLWGAIAVACLGLPTLSFWQFAGLLWLIHIVFPGSTATVSNLKKEWMK